MVVSLDFLSYQVSGSRITFLMQKIEVFKDVLQISSINRFYEFLLGLVSFYYCFLPHLTDTSASHNTFAQEFSEWTPAAYKIFGKVK